MKQLLFLTLALVLASPAVGQGKVPLVDHPLVSGYEGAKMRRKEVQDFDEYNAFMGMDEAGKEPVGLALEGKVTKMLYGKPKDRSILEVFRNFENAMTQSGAEILFSCNQEKRECAERYAGPTIQKYSGITSVANLYGRYLLAKVSDAANTAYIAIAVGQTFIDIHVVKVQEMDTEMVTLDAAALGKGLDNQGYVVVQGIYFDTDKATLKPESSVAMNSVAQLFDVRPELSVYVVGHTDMQGSFEHNRTLSLRRAQAVVAELIAGHGIARDRLGAHGVGPLAPQASNKTDGGRALNRRVVLVAR